MEFDLILNKNTASCVSVPVEFSEEYGSNYINISVCKEPKSNTEVAVADGSKKQRLRMRGGSRKRSWVWQHFDSIVVINKNGKEIQYGVCQIITDGNIKCAQKIKVASGSTSNLIHYLSSVHGIMQIDYWGLTGKIFTITLDNGANVKAAINKIEGLVVGKGLLSAEVFVAHAKRLINFFISPKQNERLENAQQSLQIPEANNSCFLAWERLLLVKDYIDIVLFMLSKDNSSEACQDYNRLKKIMLVDDEWSLMNDLIHLLGPFNEYTEYFSGSEYVMISMMYPLITALISNRSLDKIVRNKYKNILM
ncbi:13429_t:CDS:2 [Cetraspora pellucida]|uniref:13429_t:CDS:1 n=1 Tax=Cetraspora pellucida TaxID=1433469 RepID=A0ACA9JWT4_9GLOM|nr:13429_t:CDS:2 [Cetraspora pellucida]